MSNLTMDSNSCDGSLFSFECGPDYSFYQHWLLAHYRQSFISVAVYLGFIYFGQKLMASRKAIKLDRSLFLWNVSLAIFSTLGTYRLAEESLHLLREEGYHGLLCNGLTDKVRAFWIFAFALSKIVEFGDTVFLILRKRPVIFLHWYHHITVLLFTWHACAHKASFGRLFMLMNYFVHSVMYTYYALASIGIRTPKFISMSITTLQILQMVGGVGAVLYVRDQLASGVSCAVRQEIVTSGLLMYASYFVLFVKFFVDAYVSKKNRCSQKSSCSKSCTTPPRPRVAGEKNPHDSNCNNVLSCGGDSVNGKCKSL